MNDRHQLAPEYADAFELDGPQRWDSTWPALCGAWIEGPWIFLNLDGAPGVVSCRECDARADAL